MPRELIVPLYAEATDWTITIDGVTYRPAKVDPDGRLVVALDVAADDIRLSNNNYGSAQTNTEQIAAPGSALRIIVTGLFFSTAVAGNFELTQSAGTPTTVFGPHYFGANDGISAPTLSAPIRLNLNSALRITSSPAGAHTLTIVAKVA